MAYRRDPKKSSYNSFVDNLEPVRSSRTSRKESNSTFTAKKESDSGTYLRKAQRLFQDLNKIHTDVNTSYNTNKYKNTKSDIFGTSNSSASKPTRISKKTHEDLSQSVVYERKTTEVARYESRTPTRQRLNRDKSADEIFGLKEGTTRQHVFPQKEWGNREFEPKYRNINARERMHKEMYGGRSYTPTARTNYSREKNGQGIESIFGGTKRSKTPVADISHDSLKGRPQTAFEIRKSQTTSNIFGTATDYSGEVRNIPSKRVDEWSNDPDSEKKRQNQHASDLFDSKLRTDKRLASIQSERIFDASSTWATSGLSPQSSKKSMDAFSEKQANLSSSFFGSTCGTPERRRKLNLSFDAVDRSVSPVNSSAKDVKLNHLKSNLHSEDFLREYSDPGKVRKSLVYSLQCDGLQRSATANDIKDVCKGVHCFDINPSVNNITGDCTGKVNLKIRATDKTEFDKVIRNLQGCGYQVIDTKENLRTTNLSPSKSFTQKSAKPEGLRLTDSQLGLSDSRTAPSRRRTNSRNYMKPTQSMLLRYSKGSDQN